MDDLFYNAGGGTLYLRFNERYYVRRIGYNWKQIPESEAPHPETWDKLHETQRNHYRQHLITDKLIDE